MSNRRPPHDFRFRQRFVPAAREHEKRRGAALEEPDADLQPSP
jgi:hypothetical protein